MATRHSIESTLVSFARHLHARRGLSEVTVHNYISAIRRLVPVIGFAPTPKAIEQYIERIHKLGASFLAIKEQLGHAFVETTMIYVHSSPEHTQLQYRMHAPSYL